MKNFLLLSILSASASAMLAKEVTQPIQPIYIGDVFLPPSMHFLAWTSPPPSSQFLNTQPSKNTSLSLPSSTPPPSPEWCRSAIAIHEHEPFNLAHPNARNGILENLQLFNYFSQNGSAAYITRHGMRWAECHVTPESGKVGSCNGDSGDVWDGWGTRTWSCWGDFERVVKGEERRREGILRGSLGSGFTGSGEGVGARRAEKTVGVRASEVLQAFTAVMTGLMG
ncbi:hypothetical protein CJF31_00008802 [Rutstroemia sp. NJR-2017a BVV2]|nr:hypothetical protein CJF31_00008802 [Rutstroemia sp. NJR-2017a BVV2]